MGISSSACSTRRKNQRRSPPRNPCKIRRRKSVSPVTAGRKSARWKSSVRRCRWKKESWICRMKKRRMPTDKRWSTSGRNISVQSSFWNAPRRRLSSITGRFMPTASLNRRPGIPRYSSRSCHRPYWHTATPLLPLSPMC